MSQWTSVLTKISAWQQTESVEIPEEEKQAELTKKVLAKWKVNSIDERSIYAIGPKDVASKAQSVATRPLIVEDLVPKGSIDLNSKVERQYIKKMRITSPTLRTFKRHIIQKYNAPPRDLGLGYRMPRPPKERKDEHELAVEAIRKKPTVIKTTSLSSLTRPVRCEDRKQVNHIYCDVLGPASCSVCIELTNKHMAEELQDRLFPHIDTTTNSLVAPRVADVLCNSDRAAGYVPYMRDGVIDYKELRRKSTVTDRFRRLKIALHDAPPTTTARASSSRRRRTKKNLPALAFVLKALL